MSDPLRKAAEMALETLELLDKRGGLGLDVHEYIRTKIEALRQALAQPEQEPVAWYFAGSNIELPSVALDEELDARQKTNCIPLYTAPPKREWVGLTDEEISDITGCARPDYINIKKAEQILKDKNT